MTQAWKQGYSKVIKPTSKQTGPKNRSQKKQDADRRKRALKPGVRKSRTGREYTETRKNRSDIKGATMKRTAKGTGKRATKRKSRK